MRNGFLILSVLGLVFMAVQSAGAVMMTFEDPDLDVGDTFYVGESFFASGRQILVGGYYPTGIGGDLITDGDVSIGDSGGAGASGKELEISNVNLIFSLDFDGCLGCGLALLFGENGNSINLGVNGTIVAAEDFYLLPATINGADLFVYGDGPQGSMLIITGEGIDTFTIGGEELYIDNVLICGIPEPTTVVLLGLGGLSLLVRKRNRR